MTEYLERKRRKDCFFGLHFDFHAKPAADEDIIPVGEGTTEEMIYKIIDAVNPDFIQIDCKGHPGWSSYPTKAGNPYPLIIKDHLKIWREATAKRGVALFMHYSGVIDDYQCEIHPDWAAESYEGTEFLPWLPKGITSTFGPYVDEIVIPQLMELAGDYQVDGVWLDGECWGTQTDYSKPAADAFYKSTGIDINENTPRKPGDENWQLYSDFCRDQFRFYMRRYVDAVHKKYPQFQIASNWAYSSKMPEPAEADVDFLSGDYLWADSLNSARYEGRCLAPQGKPWDLMAWGFRWRSGDRMEHCPKHPEQLKQEAAVVLALGGGFQSYYPQKKDGTVHLWQVNLMKGVAEFCRQRENYCHKASFIPQVAILNSTYNRYHTSKYLFQCEGEDLALQGIVQLFCESGQSFEILSEHHLTDSMDKYPLIVIPETKLLGEEFLGQLVEYAEKGGSLLIIGTDSYNIFAKSLNLKGSVENGEFFISEDGITWAFNRGKVITKSNPGNPMGFLSASNNIDQSEKHSAAEIMLKGKGKIGFILADIGEIYLTRKNHVHRNLLKKIASELYNPIVKISDSRFIDMTLMKKERWIIVNMVNTSGSHDDQDVYTIDKIMPIGPFRVDIQIEKEPVCIRLLPTGEKIETEWNACKKVLEVFVPGLDIYEMLVIEN